MPEIIVKLGDNILQKYFFFQDRISIGRSPDNDVVIENLAVSRLHAIILKQGEGYVINDEGSSNGTFVNAVRVKRAEVLDRDVIQIGKHQLFFYDSQAAGAPRQAMPADYERTMLVSPEPAAPAELTVIKGRQKGESFVLEASSTTLGRGADCDVRVGDWLVSRHHAIIERRNDKYMIRDLQSWRHTMVNGQVVSEEILRDGDVIALGPTVQLAFALAAQKSEEQPLRRVPRELNGGSSPMHVADLAEMSHNTVQQESGGAAGHADPLKAAEELVEDLAAVSLRAAAEDASRSMDEQPAQPVQAGEATDEIRMWEKALKNKSQAIRKQAARRLKQLTGHDYDF